MDLGSVQKKIVGAMFLILVICLSLMTFATSRKTEKFPPTINQCPDFFTFDGTKCNSPDSLYSTSYYIDITSADSQYISTKADSTCKKKSWAKSNSVTWDGITNDDSIIPC